MRKGGTPLINTQLTETATKLPVQLCTTDAGADVDTNADELSPIEKNADPPHQPAREFRYQQLTLDARTLFRSGEILILKVYCWAPGHNHKASCRILPQPLLKNGDMAGGCRGTESRVGLSPWTPS
eukprot:2707778-Pyramimonas_sp.AAC.1